MKKILTVLFVSMIFLGGCGSGSQLTPDDNLLSGNYKLDKEKSTADSYMVVKDTFAKIVPGVEPDTISYSFTKKSCTLHYGNNESKEYAAKFEEVNGDWTVDCMDGDTMVYSFQFHSDFTLELSNETRIPTRAIYKRS